MKVLIVGFGVIGEGVARIIHEKHEKIKDQGIDIKVVGICEIDHAIKNKEGINLEEVLKLKKEKGNLKSHPNVDLNSKTHEYIRNLDADVLIDVTPTNIETGEPTLSNIKEGFKAKKHVITSSKGPLALKYSELIALAKKNNLDFRYEAAVGGCIPVMSLSRGYFKCNKIESIMGILNGTTNYILTRMSNENAPLSQVLKEAQQMGIAEKNASYDIDGVDTACKVVILANELFGIDVSYKDIEVEGISKITPEFLQLAKKKGFVVKLVGEITDNEIEIAPKLIPQNHPLNVGGVLNAITIKTDYTGDITLVGYGAGQLETSSAIVNDLIEIGK